MTYLVNPRRGVDRVTYPPTTAAHAGTPIAPQVTRLTHISVDDDLARIAVRYGAVTFGGFLLNDIHLREVIQLAAGDPSVETFYRKALRGRIDAAPVDVDLALAWQRHGGILPADVAGAI